MREPSEFSAGHIAGSELIPLGKLLDECRKWDARKPLTVVCRSGRRAERARVQLVANGFKDVIALQGGVEKWRANGNPLIGESRRATTPGVRWDWVTSGLAFLLSIGLAQFVSPWFLVATALIGIRIIAAR